uniref:Uncharacterized protein n=1 Tax=Sinocyclocheilus rhinocerous TaxID=307959 RepID=A0A673JWZ0_9TELE
MEGRMVRHHSVHFRGVLSAQPIIVNFHQLFQTRDAPAILPMIKNENVLRAVVALLDTSLPDIGPRGVHETVHYPGMHTIILSRDHAEDYRGRASQTGASLRPVFCKTTVKADSTHKLLAAGDSEESPEETSEEIIATETSSSWSWEQFCEGLQEFVDGVRDRKERRAEQEDEDGDGEIPPSSVGVESLIVAAACYELKIISTGDMHLGIGSYIMELLKTQSVVGKYDTLVAHADTDSFCFGMLYRELKDDWTNSILMSYLPPFTTNLEMRNPVFSLMVSLFLKRSQALFAYQQQVMCVTRLLEELDLQHEEVDRLNSKLELEKRKRHDIGMFVQVQIRYTSVFLPARFTLSTIMRVKAAPTRCVLKSSLKSIFVI